MQHYYPHYHVHSNSHGVIKKKLSFFVEKTMVPKRNKNTEFDDRTA